MKRYLAAWMLVVFSTVTPTPAIGAGEESDASTDQEAGKLMLVLDSSGSMSEPADDGRTRIEAAKEALHTLINQLPDDQPVGMRVLGATQPTRAGAEVYCTDSQNVAPVETGNREQLSQAVDAYQPYGETPIAYALSEAGKDLGSEGQRSIVLVSDGEPSCDPDPCVVASELRAGGIDVRIDVIGLNVSGPARDKLACIAESGGGTYYEATDTQSLIDSLTTVQTRSARPFDFTGEPVEGTPEAQGAPQITPGVWLDTLSTGGSKWYRVPRTASGSTIHVGALVRGLEDTGATGAIVRLRATPESAVCEQAAPYEVTLGQRQPILTASGDTWKAEGNDECNTSDEIWIEVEPSGSAQIGGHPISLFIYEEPPVSRSALDDLPEAPQTPSWTSLTPAEDPNTDVVPGTSFINAPILSEDSYAFDINPGETQVVGIPVDWNQSIEAQLDAPMSDQIGHAAAVGSDFNVDIVSPLLATSSIRFDFSNQPDDWFESVLMTARDGDHYRTGAQSETIAFRHRANSDEATRGATLPGIYYVRVTLNIKDAAGNVPYTLTLKTFESDGDNAPSYDEVDGLNPPQSDSRLVDMSWVDDNTVSDEDDEATATTDDSGSGLPWLPIGLGTAGVLALGGAGAMMVRTRINARQ